MDAPKPLDWLIKTLDDELRTTTRLMHTSCLVRALEMSQPKAIKTALLREVSLRVIFAPKFTETRSAF